MAQKKGIGSASSYDNTFRVWELKTSEMLCVVDQGNAQVGLLALSPDGKKVLACNANRRNVVYSVTSGESLFSLPWPKSGFDSAVFSPDGTSIATGDWDGTVIIWTAEDGQKRQTLPTPSPLPDDRNYPA